MFPHLFVTMFRLRPIITMCVPTISLQSNVSKLNQVSNSLIKNLSSFTDGDKSPVVDKNLDENIDLDPLIFERDFADIKLEDYESLYRDIPELREKIAVILSEYEYEKYNSFGKVPSNISVREMSRILTEGDLPYDRKCYLNYLFKTEMKRLHFKKKRGIERMEIQERRTQKLKELRLITTERSGLVGTEGELVYGLWHNSLLRRIPDKKFNHRNVATKLRLAAMFGPKLVFDFSYEKYMKGMTMRNTCEQIREAYAINRTYREPFDLWFCNFDAKSPMGQFTEKLVKVVSRPNLMVSLKKDCMTNHIDRTKLVYLSPDAREPLSSLDIDKTYIIGAYNDKGGPLRVSQKKAENLRIVSRRLPLDKHVLWEKGSKSLCLNHVLGILLEYHANGGSWKDAFLKHIPTRKLKTVETLREEEKLRREKYMKNPRRYTGAYKIG